MKTNLLTLFLISSVMLSCKKRGFVFQPDEFGKTSFAYSKYKIANNALADINLRSTVLTLTFREPGIVGGLPKLSIQINNYIGPGTYNFDNGKVIVFGQENMDEFYWSNNFPQGQGGKYSQGKIIIKQNGKEFTAEVKGELIHSSSEGNQQQYLRTNLSGHLIKKF